jgi:hypothetical protein
MKVFNLKCEHGHEFEGWFKGHDAFEEQQSQGLLTCPLCDSHAIEKALSAPRLNLSAPVASGEGAQALAQALKVVRDLLENSEDVGDRFAEEARAMHAKQTPLRSIHGETSIETARELAQEGIAVVALPFAGVIKRPLQ